ncbi:MAG: response regulator [Anaerolineales bacterium]|nr:response regulator [Anaerolineales bacterium]
MDALAFIIEDDIDLSTIFADALDSVGYHVVQIKDGLKAQQRLKEEVPYLILLDMHLPHISGADLLAEIKADERFKNTTVILTTADARMAEAYEPMADFVMVKPISFVQLRDLTSRLKPK